MLETRVWITCEAASQFKKPQTAVSTTERYFPLSVVCLIVECTWRQRKGNYKKNIQIVVGCLGWKWIEGLSYNYYFLNKKNYYYFVGQDVFSFSLIIEDKGNPRLTLFRLARTSVITVQLFVTMGWLARGQTSVITVKIGAIVSASVKNFLHVEIYCTHANRTHLVQGNDINCHKTGLAALAQNRFQALTLHAWE